MPVYSWAIESSFECVLVDMLTGYAPRAIGCQKGKPDPTRDCQTPRRSQEGTRKAIDPASNPQEEGFRVEGKKKKKEVGELYEFRDFFAFSQRNGQLNVGVNDELGSATTTTQSDCR